MRELSMQEMASVSGGWGCYSYRRTSCYSYSRTSCQPKPTCEPKPVCEPKPPCGTDNGNGNGGSTP